MLVGAVLPTRGRINVLERTIKAGGLGEHHDGKAGAMRFEVVTKGAGITKLYHARIKGGNGEIIFSSQNYTAKESAKKACETVKANASGASIVEVTE